MPPDNLLEGYKTETELAEELGISKRTIARYRNEPDGLPFVMFGGRVYVDIEGGRRWLRRRVQHPNPPRTARVKPEQRDLEAAIAERAVE